RPPTRARETNRTWFRRVKNEQAAGRSRVRLPVGNASLNSGDTFHVGLPAREVLVDLGADLLAELGDLQAVLLGNEGHALLLQVLDQVLLGLLRGLERLLGQVIESLQDRFAVLLADRLPRLLVDE